MVAQTVEIPLNHLTAQAKSEVVERGHAFEPYLALQSLLLLDAVWVLAQSCRMLVSPVCRGWEQKGVDGILLL